MSENFNSGTAFLKRFPAKILLLDGFYNVTDNAGYSAPKALSVNH